MTTATHPRPHPLSGAIPSPYSPVLPSAATSAFATKLLHDLGRYALVDTVTGQRTDLDQTVFLLLQRLLSDLAAGNAVSIIPFHHELSSFEAADFLGVSRPTLISLIDRGELPGHRVGTHRRIRMADLLAYKARIDQDTDEALDELTRLSQLYG